MTHKIYGHKSPSQKWYIGRTCQTFMQRFGKYGQKYKTQTKFANAINKYSWDNFEHIFIAECETEEQAIIAEAIFKRIYDSVDNGYNCNAAEEDKSPMYGKHLSTEHKQKISKGNTGKKHSPEMIERNRLSQLGKILSEEHKQAISEGLRGGKRTEETKQKLSEQKLGEKNPMYGKIPWNKGKTNFPSSWNKGIKATSGHKKKQSDSAKKQNQPRNENGRFISKGKKIK